MNELPPISGGTSVQTEAPANNPEKGPGVKFNDRMVRSNQPCGQHLVKGNSGRYRSTGDTQPKLRERNASYSSDESYPDSVRSDVSVVADFEGVESDSEAYDDDSVIASVLSEIEDDIPAPSENFPVPVDSDTEGATITIGSSRVEDNSSVNGDESITIEGAGKVSKSALAERIKSVFGKIWNAFKNNPLLVGFAVCLTLAIVFGTMLTPVGAPIGMLLLTGMFAALSCGFAGGLIAQFMPFPEQHQPQPNHSQNPNPQHNPNSKSSSDTDTAKSQPESNQHSSTNTSNTGDSLDSTTDGKTTPTSVAANASGRSSVPSVHDSVAAREVNGKQPENQVSPEEIFDEWLNKNFLSIATRARFSEFSQTLRSIDDCEGHSVEEECDADTRLETVIKEVTDRVIDLSAFMHSPSRESDSSGLRQEVRLAEFREQLQEALEILNPKVEYRQKMYNTLLQALPAREHPLLSPNLNSPLLSVGETRKSLEGFSKEDLARVEVYDMLKVTLQVLAGNGGGSEQQKESDDQKRYHQALAVKRSRIADSQDKSLSTKVRDVEGISLIDAGPVESIEKGVQGDLDDKLKRETDERRNDVLERLERNLTLQESDMEIPDHSIYGVRKSAFLLDIRSGVFDWSNRQEAPGASLEGRKVDLTAENYQKLVVIELGKAVYDVGKQLLNPDGTVMSGGNGNSDQSVFDLETAANRRALLEDIFSREPIRKAFEGTKATEAEQDIAKNYLRSYIGKKI